MKKCLRVLGFAALLTVCAGVSQAYEHEVYKSGGKYYYKTYGVVRGNTSDLATAIQNAINTGNRTLYINCGGSLSKTVNMQSGLTINGLGNTLSKSGGNAFYGSYKDNLKVCDVKLSGGTIRFTGCNNVTCDKVNVSGGGIGIRVDSHSSQPYNHWVSNFKATNCTFSGGSSHGIETYGVSGYYISNIKASNMGECGVLINKSKGGSIGTVDAYRCCRYGGYAGLRFANSCDGCTVSKVIAKECGRGFFTTTQSKNITVNDVYIRNCKNQAIFIEYSSNVHVKGGTYNGKAQIKESSNCSNKAKKV